MGSVTTPTAAPCLRCNTTGGTTPSKYGIARRRQGYCDRCYERLHRGGALTVRPAHGGWHYHQRKALPAIVTPAMLGIKPGQPATDPGLHPEQVLAIGNTNARRALAWLTAHTGIEETQALARVVWMPAQLDTAARKAA